MSRGQSAILARTIKSILEAKTHYAVLDVAETADAATIKKVYFDLARTVHPDKGGCAEAFKRLNEAKAVLCDQGARRE